MTLSLPPLPAAFATASQNWPLAAQQTLANVRRVVHTMCTGCDAAPLQETLKWGEPSWLPRAPRIGTTLRAAWKPQRPDHFGLFVHCQTSIAAEFDALYPPHSGPPLFTRESNRAIWLPLDAPVPEGPIGHLALMALTYHRRT
ncbi:MAG: hypothetical protein ACSHWZ_06860 [Sulfitobacter sp.]